MDRLPALILVSALAIAGCEEGGAERPSPPPSRVVAVAAAEEEVEDLCELAPAASAAPVLTFPTLASGSAPAAGRARWLNVWATWCRPCVEEMPMLAEWTARMRAERADVELVFLSADASEEAVTAFRATHADAPETLRIADPAALEAWVTTVGLDAGATLPIHVITDAEGRVRCARTGAVSEDDYERMRDLVRGL